MHKIKIGTRGSRLALWQAELVLRSLEYIFPDIKFEQVIIKTEGDRDQNSSLTQIGGQGVFTKTIEDALFSKRIDIAVHSLKDLPSQMAEGLELGAVLERGPVEDVLVTVNGSTLEGLPPNAVVATGSIRRRSQLLRLRPDLKVVDLRGNIDTRLRILEGENVDAIFMARAAIERLELTDVKYFTFAPDILIPAVGQGAIGVQIRQNDDVVLGLVKKIDHEPTNRVVVAERTMLHRLDSGCQFPVGGHARYKNDVLQLVGFVASENGDKLLKRTVESDPFHAEKLGVECAELLIKDGALDILNAPGQ